MATSPYTTTIPAAQGYQGYQGQFATGTNSQPAATGDYANAPAKAPTTSTTKATAGGSSTTSTSQPTASQPTSTSNNSIAGNSALAVAAAQVPQQYALPDAQNSLTQWTQSTYGKQLSPEQWQQLAKHVGYTNGNVTQQQMDAAKSAIQQYAPQLGWQQVQQQPAAPAAPAPPPPLTAPNGTNNRVNIDPIQTYTTANATAIIQQHAQQWFGRPLTPAELDQVAQFVGFAGQPSVNGRTVNSALDLLQLWGGSGAAGGTGSGGSGSNNSNQMPVWKNPIDPALANSYNTALMKALKNPTSLSPEVVEAMKAKQREETLSYLEQMQQQMAQNAARRGTLPGGVTAANERRLNDTAASQMTLGNREIDINAAKTNFDDNLQTINTVGQGMGQQHSQGLAGYQAQLQAALANAGLKLDQDRLNQSNWQFNQGYGLNYLQLLNDMIMGRANYGINLAGLQQNAQNGMFNWMGSMFPGAR